MVTVKTVTTNTTTRYTTSSAQSRQMKKATPMTIQNPPKALIALVGLICVTLLMALKSIDQATGMPVLTLVIGYAVGNGIAARSGQTVQPIIGQKDK